MIICQIFNEVNGMHQGKKEMVFKSWNQMVNTDFHNKLELEDLIVENAMLQKNDYYSLGLQKKR